MDIEIAEMTPADYDETVALWEACEGVCLGDMDDREHITPCPPCAKRASAGARS